MTSVPNHLLQSNGSRIAACCLIFVSFLACSTSKATKKTHPAEHPKAEEKVRVYDPASGEYILVPKSAVKVDTVKWKQDPAPPIVIDKETKIENPEKKTAFNISLLIPFNVHEYPFLQDQLDAKLLRFLQYYAGMRIAASEFKGLGYPVTINVLDSKSSATDLNEILKEPGIKNADVIVGLNDKENIEALATFGLQHDKLVVSPWLPAFNIENENPLFIQVVPGLSTHADAIMDYINEEMKGKKVFLVARNNATEKNRLQLFKNNQEVKTEDLIINDPSVELERTNLNSLLSENGTIFILPYYSRSDESFVNSFMRKLHADKETKEVIVFGLPQWTSFSNLNPNYMESLSVHISSSTFVDIDNPLYHDFRDRFYKEFHTIPDQHAYMGYDLLKWLGKTLSMHGKSGLMGNQYLSYSGISSGFDIKPVFKSALKTGAEMKVPLYYENSKVRILKYENQDFILVR